MMSSVGLSLLRKLNPEDAHGLALWSLRKGLVQTPECQYHLALQQTLWGQTFTSPIGVAAGFDKNARVYKQLGAFGFGFTEVGAVTPRPQAGNARPRVFRLPQDKAVINRYGFNNDGLDVIAQRLADAKSAGTPVWVNVGANKDSADRIADYQQVVARLAPHVSGLTLNVSSPNTQDLRRLQAADALHTLVDTCRTTLGDAQIPLMVKIAPDLDDADLQAVADAVQGRIDALIATNTTLDREGLKSPYKKETGGLSGRPLFEKSTQVLRRLYQLTEGSLTLIGVGGVEDAHTAYAKIKAGASLVQLYTGLVYGGLDLCEQINTGLVELLRKDGFDTINQAVGANHR